MSNPVLNLLMVEDNPGFAQIVGTMLHEDKKANVALTIASNLSDGLAKLESHEFNAVILDLNLPDSFGLDTIKRLRMHSPAIPIVVATGEDDEELAENALKAGAQDFFAKTELTPNLLHRVINYAIERKEFELTLTGQADNLEKMVKKRTSQLENAKRQWERTFDAVPDYISILDKEHRIVRANMAMAKCIGLTPQELIGKHCYHLTHQTDEPFPGCPHQQLLEDGLEHIVEFYEPRIQIDLLVSTSPLFDEDGKLQGSVHVARDISQVKKAQEALKQSEAQHRMFLERMPDPTVIYDSSGKVIFANAAFENTFGWSSQELMGQQVDFVPSDVKSETMETVKTMMKGMPVKDFRTARFTKDGRRLEIRLNTSPIFDEEGQQNGNIVILRDITEILKTREDALASQEQYRMLVENMNEAIEIIDADGFITYVNEQFAQMVGYKVEEIIGMNLRDLIAESDLEMFEKRWQARKAGEDANYELLLKAKDGHYITTMASARPRFDKDGEFIGAFALLVDITERKNLEMQLMQSQKMEGIGQLAAGIAHEINTPAQYVSSNTRFLVDSFADIQQLIAAYASLTQELKESNLMAEHVANIEALNEELDYEFLAEEIPQALSANQEGMDRIATIVRSMKEFAHPGQEDKMPSDLNKAIENTITVARNEWKYVSDLTTDFDPDLPPVPCVVGEINQVILNIIVNAAHAISDVVTEGVDSKGTIIISTHKDGDYAQVKITDSGGGMPQKIKDRIFDPFFTTKEPGKGTGQGLAIAYRCIVDHHKGNIAVESQEGEGTTFIIDLPLTE